MSTGSRSTAWPTRPSAHWHSLNNQCGLEGSDIIAGQSDCTNADWRLRLTPASGNEEKACDLCVPKTSSTLCDQAIFVDQATNARLSSDAVLTGIDRLGWRFQRRGAVQRAARSALVVMDLLLAQEPPQMSLVPDEGSVQELAAASADQRSVIAFIRGVRTLQSTARMPALARTASNACCTFTYWRPSSSFQGRTLLMQMNKIGRDSRGSHGVGPGTTRRCIRCAGSGRPGAQLMGEGQRLVQQESTATGPDAGGPGCTLLDGDLRRWTAVDGLPLDGMQEVWGSNPHSSTPAQSGNSKS
jgi:hypothetical protein